MNGLDHETTFQILSNERLFWQAWRADHPNVGIDDPGAIVAALRFDSSVMRRAWQAAEAIHVRTENAKRAIGAMETQEAYTRVKVRKIEAFTLADLHLLVGDSLKQEEAERLAALSAELQYDPDSAEQSDLKAFLLALTGEVRSVHVAVLSHWIWQVKRKLAGRAVQNHIMIVFYGAQGAGKSEAVEALLERVDSVTLRIPFDDIVDSKTYNQLNKHAVCSVDELSGLRNTDLTKLKALITADTLDQRIFHSQNMRRVFQRCSFVGSTNTPLNELIRDPTGMRRFYEISCLDRIDWDALNDQINTHRIWNEIDEDRDEGYLVGDALAAVRREQAIATTKDLVALFLEENCLRSPIGDELATVHSGKAMFSEFLSWARDANIRNPGTRQEFERGLHRAKLTRSDTGYLLFDPVSASGASEVANGVEIDSGIVNPGRIDLGMHATLGTEALD